MFAKCAFVVVAVGACGCALLAMRQSRLQVASELARTQIRIAAADERLWALRTRIAGRVSPRNVELMAGAIGPLKPIMDAPPVAPSPLTTERIVQNGVPSPEDLRARPPVVAATPAKADKGVSPHPKDRVVAQAPTRTAPAAKSAAKKKSTPQRSTTKPKPGTRGRVVAKVAKGART